MIYFIYITNIHNIHSEALTVLLPRCVLSVIVLHVESQQEGDVRLPLPGVTSYPLPCRGLVFISEMPPDKLQAC